MIKKHLYHS